MVSVWLALLLLGFGIVVAVIIRGIKNRELDDEQLMRWLFVGLILIAVGGVWGMSDCEGDHGAACAVSRYLTESEGGDPQYP
jgi:hypothetical protein